MYRVPSIHQAIQAHSFLFLISKIASCISVLAAMYMHPLVCLVLPKVRREHQIL